MTERLKIDDYDLDPNPADPANPHHHNRVPVLKVGNFGNIRGFRTPQRRKLATLVSARMCSSRWCNTPEKFAQSWNNFGPRDYEALLQDGTAGNYDAYHTNLWMVGQLMNTTVSKTRFFPFGLEMI